MSSSAAAAENPAQSSQQDARPVIPLTSSSNLGAWAFAVVLLIGGYFLYDALSASEDQAEVPSVFQPPADRTRTIASPPPLRVPDRFGERPEPAGAPNEVSAPRPQTIIRRPPPPIVRAPPAITAPLPVRAPQRIEPARSDGPQIVFESRPQANPSSTAEAQNGDRDRVTAGRFLNPARTIPQGTVIPAVLETALDSTRAGGVRALVQRDISSFDGSRILIPRGSRLYGEYDSGIQRGEKRALVQWTRLIRPDGVTMNLDSPASDPLGRAGIKGKVDSKFLQRFGGAILQSVLDIGVGVAVNRATDGVIVALPGSTQNVRIAEPESIQPTLKVKHGTSVSVFVARDLDFSSVEP